MFFHCYSNGLHCIECPTHQFSFVETVAENMQGYLKRQVGDAKSDRDVMIASACPSLRDLNGLIKANMLMNSPVTVEDVDRAMDIFKHDVRSLKGKVVKKTPDAVNHKVVHIPHYILDRSKVIVTNIDICFANTLLFLGTIRQVKFNTIQHMANRKKKNKLSSITIVCRIYGAR